jgi:hypothetical protein
MLTSKFLSNQCDGWFRKSSSELPRPMKPFNEEPLHNSSSPRTLLEGDASKLRHKSAFNDRESFKNLSIHVSQLPVTPNRFREKYVRSPIPATPFHTLRMPTNLARAESLALQLDIFLTELRSRIQGNLGTIADLVHFELFLKRRRDYEYWNLDWEGMKSLLDHVEQEDRACLSRRMDDLRKSIQHNIDVTSFPVRRLGVFPDGPGAIPEEKEPYTFPRSIPLLPQITKQPAWGPIPQTASMPYQFTPMPNSRSIPDVPFTQPPYTPLPPPPRSAYMHYSPLPFTPLPPPPQSAYMHYTPLPLSQSVYMHYTPQTSASLAPHYQSVYMHCIPPLFTTTLPTPQRVYMNGVGRPVTLHQRPR